MNEILTTERRLWARHRAGPGNPVVATIGVAPHCALIRDLSLAGISLISSRSLPISSTVPVSIAGPKPGQIHLLVLSVLRCEVIEHGLFCVAGRFLDEASVAAAEVILTTFPNVGKTR